MAFRKGLLMNINIDFLRVIVRFQQSRNLFIFFLKKSSYDQL